METNYSNSNVSAENPLLGVANFLAAAHNGRFNTGGENLDGANKAEAAWTNFQERTPTLDNLILAIYK